MHGMSLFPIFEFKLLFLYVWSYSTNGGACWPAFSFAVDQEDLQRCVSLDGLKPATGIYMDSYKTPLERSRTWNQP